MKYNLLGQLGPEGQINSDAPEGGEYIYDNPPGQGNNPGISAPTPSPGVEEVTTENETETPNYFDIYTNLLNKTEEIHDYYKNLMCQKTYVDTIYGCIDE